MALQQHAITIAGQERAYWLAPASEQPAPLLVVLHGSGIGGLGMAQWTGLAERGPEAGFSAVFPEARAEVWDDTGQGRSDGVDDPRFVLELVEKLCLEGVARRDSVFLIGLSNGAFFAERLARYGIVQVTGLVLACGTAREVSRRGSPRPRRPAAVLCLEGTRDPLVPYTGGRPSGPLAWFAQRRARKVLVDTVGRDVVPVESLASDWAQVNGCPSTPEVELITRRNGDPKVHRLTWVAPGHLPVVLYRIVGGGHGWPGGPQYMPAVLIGRVPRHFDATQTILDFARTIIRGGDLAASRATPEAEP